MVEQIISFFAKRHLLTNMMFVCILLGGVFAWNNTNKEEMPAITFDTMRISVVYPGAPAADVEYFITEPIEEAVRGLDGVYRITSTSSVGQSNVSVELEPDYALVDEAFMEIRNEVLDVRLPDDVIDDPHFRVFKTTKKAIIDIALYFKDQHLLDTASRQKLQEYALALENQLLSQSAVHSVTRRGYLQEEIQIKVNPEALRQYDIPFNDVMRTVQNNHIRQPAGSLETQQEPKVTLLSELNTPEALNELVVQGGFDGKVVRLNQVAHIAYAHEKPSSVMKVNGYEAVMFNVIKSGSYGILDALESVRKVVSRFEQSTLKDSPIKVVFLDDESIDVRNRLHIITWNGLIGFVLILIVLFIFLNKRSGFWVAMGIPFTICFTMIMASLMGFTINGTTLAAVIIVLGIVVDDAIVVAENITRKLQEGVSEVDAAVKGTAEVLMPVFASIVTTCAAFVPLFFFSGRFGNFTEFIPPIIFLMLGASLIESILILPGHMGVALPWLINKNKPKTVKAKVGGWFERVEDRYGDFLEQRILRFKWPILLGFVALFVGSLVLMNTQMKFVMFPHEETRDLVLSGYTQDGSTRYETAEKVREIEDLVVPYMGQEVVGLRTEIARSRRGGPVEENYFRMIIEIVPKEKRKRSADDMIAIFEKDMKSLEGFHKVRFQKSRWGFSSGSPIEVVVQENNDARRHSITELLVEAMQAFNGLKNVEADEGFRVPEYRIAINREMIKRLSIEPSDIASTLRASLEGRVLYEFSNGDEDVDVRFTIKDEAKDDIEKILDLPVENRGDYLVPLRNIVSVEEITSPTSIARRDLKRTTLIDADIDAKVNITPLDIALHFEDNVFPDILAQYPSAVISFGGEVQDTRESTQDFSNAIMLVIFLIYVILVLLFNSLSKPFVIMLSIPFGVVGIILAFYLHGYTLYGFYAVVGALGLAGVVINDSIIMLVKMDKAFDMTQLASTARHQIAVTAKTRLRAVMLTTLTTVAGVMPTAYGLAGYDAMLADMMMALAWGLVFGTLITLVLIPCVYNAHVDARYALKRVEA